MRLRARSRTGEAIRFLLVTQLAMAGWLMARDLSLSLPHLGFAPRAPALTRPVTPGDQTRRYDPARLPLLSPGPATRRFPQLDALPPRGCSSRPPAPIPA